MGSLGFLRGEHEERSHVAPNRTSEKSSVAAARWLKISASALGLAMVLGGIVWGSATMVAGLASDADLNKVADKVDLVEKNDIRQTVILEHLKETLDKIDIKLDKALK